MIDLVFKVASIIIFIVGIIFRLAPGVGDPFDGSYLMVAGVFMFLFAHMITELREIKEKLGQK